MCLKEGFTRRTCAVCAGFTSTDLVATAATVVLIGVLLVPVLGRENDASHRAVCLANLRQIMTAVTMYAAENSDSLPHPTWGSVDGSASAGPDGWAYATANKGRVPGGPDYIPNVAGRMSNSNQLPFYAAGQLARFLPGQQVLMCPTDWASAQTVGKYAQWYRERSVKLTSYTMNGAVCGYGGTGNPRGTPFKLSAFGPSDLLLWEADETIPFNFSDAASNPANAVENGSQRHSGMENAAPALQIPNGLIHVGRAGGMAERIPAATLKELRASGGVRHPNDLLCGPGFE